MSVDLHRATSKWVLLDAERNVRLKKVVPSTPQHVEAALSLLPDLGPVRAVVEPVCGWRWFCDILDRRGIDVRIANPLKVRLIAESRMKHDALDARMLAELLKSGFLPEAYRAPDDIAAVRALIRERAFLVYTRTAVKNRIHGVLVRQGLHTMTYSPKRKAGQEEIREGGDTELARLLALSEDLSTRILPLDRRVAELAKDVPLVALMKTMPGIGDVTGVTVYAEIGDFGRFPTPGKLAAYAGLVPSQRSSGASVKHGHITKTGSRFLRAALVEAAYRVRNRENAAQLYAFYERILPACGAKRARVALARKMLTILWYMAKANRPYTPLPSEHAPKRDDLAQNPGP